jgi:multiple sugar transport system permease protein
MQLARRRSAAGLALLAPTLLGVALFFLIPAVALVGISTQRWDLLAPPRFDGLGPLLAVLADPRLPGAVAATAEIGGIALAVELVVGYALGRLLAFRGRSRRALAVVLLCPWMIAPLVVGVVARWILAPSDGVLAHLIGRRVDLLADPGWAPVAAAGTMAWQDTGFAVVVLAAAIRAIPPELRAAAALDGAGRWRIIHSIELPLLVPAGLFLAVTGIVRAFGLYDLIVPLTGGGPAGSTLTLTGVIVSTAWDGHDIGGAAALSLLTGAAALLVAGAIGMAARRLVR